jgi:hypothetical protein
MTEVKVDDPPGIINIIDRLPEREYQNMADVEKSVGQRQGTGIAICF